MENDKSMKYAHSGIIHVARSRPMVTAEYAQHGNPAVRRAAEFMACIAGLPEQETARVRQLADNALEFMPFREIEECIELWQRDRSLAVR